jgi:hypothetical protein
VVVVAGLTVVDPLADVEVKVPGVMAMPVAPVVAQVSVELEPDSILLGLAVNDVIVSLDAAKHASAEARRIAQKPISIETRMKRREEIAKRKEIERIKPFRRLSSESAFDGWTRERIATRRTYRRTEA